MYDPTAGRFTTEDPIAFAGGDPNLYRYVHNSPTNFIDRTGNILYALGKGVAENYVKWLTGDKDNVFTKAHGHVGPKIDVAFHEVPIPILRENEPLYVILPTFMNLGPDGKRTALGADEKTKLIERIKALANKAKTDIDKNALEALVDPKKNILLTTTEAPGGAYSLDGKKVDISFRESAGPKARWLALQSIVNNGIPVETGVKERAGPDVTKWFARDLIKQLQYRELKQGNALSDIYRFKEQAAEVMTYKWIDFGGEKTGRGVNTVTLAGYQMRRNVLGNIALAFVGAIYPPNSFTQEGAKAFHQTYKGFFKPTSSIVLKLDFFSTKEAKVAMLGYSIVPNWDDKQWGLFRFNTEVASTFLNDEIDHPLYRADNLAGFGLGISLAHDLARKYDKKNRDKGMEILRQKVKQSCTDAAVGNELVSRMEEVIREDMGNEDVIAKAVNRKPIREIQPHPPDVVAPAIELSALTTTMDFGGFNTMSLQKSIEEIDPKQFPDTLKFFEKIQEAYEAHKKRNPADKDLTLEDFRIKYYEDYTKRSGIGK